jgi:uncharacterized protein (DUF1800 family)
MSLLDSTLGSEAAHLLLGRAGYGARPGEADLVGQGSLQSWLDSQLALPQSDAVLEAHLAAMTLPLRYVGTTPEAVFDSRATLETLTASQATNWNLSNFRIPMPNAERDRPFQELSVATVARKVLARAQLRERLVEFWHDHFSVAVHSSAAVSVSIVDHDRRIRQHALGRFRDLLEAMTTSPAMLTYLSNRTSRAGAPNENYSRELLELHTLGVEAYYGSSRNAARVPGATSGRPEGYTDGDVWEAARALTGWTIADGQRLENGRTLPTTGSFAYAESSHDPYQKRFLGQAFEPFGPAMADGRAVLDACAAHPATARNIVAKLARFLIGPSAPSDCVARGVDAFNRHGHSPDQMARVVRALLTGPEVTDRGQGRVRRPLDLVTAAMRALTQRPWINTGLMNAMADAGQGLFYWPSPEGQSLAPAAYLNGAALRSRWFLIMAVATNQHGTGAAAVYPGLTGLPVLEVTTELSRHLFGTAETAAARIVADRWSLARPGQRPQEREVAELAGWLMMAPAFQST